MTEREKILDRIRKVKAMAEDDSASEAAAANYAMKMAELMRKHAVEESELENYSELDRKGCNFDHKYFDAWRISVMTECATSCGTYVVFYRKARPAYFRIYGRPEAVEVTWEMFKFIEQQIVRISREMYSETKLSRQAQKGLGFGVCERMGLMRDDIKEDSPSGRNELVVVETEQELSKDAMHEELGEPLKYKRKKIEVTEAVAQGYRQADRVKIHKEVKDGA